MTTDAEGRFTVKRNCQSTKHLLPAGNRYIGIQAIIEIYSNATNKKQQEEK